MINKYEYEVSFEDAIKQGIPKEEYSRESSKNCILTWIANELAEANRLKKVEIRQKCGMHYASILDEISDDDNDNMS